MPDLTLGALRLEAYPMPTGTMRVIVHSQAGQQELVSLTFAEWVSLERVATIVNAAHGTLETHVMEIRRLDLTLAKERQERTFLLAKLESARDFFAKQKTSEDGNRREMSTLVANVLDGIMEGSNG